MKRSSEVQFNDVVVKFRNIVRWCSTVERCLGMLMNCSVKLWRSDVGFSSVKVLLNEAEAN